MSKYLDNFIDRVKGPASDPRKFFATNKDDLGKVFKYLLILMIIPTISSFISMQSTASYIGTIMDAYYLGGSEIAGMFSLMFSSFGFVFAIAGYFIGLINVFILALLVHLFWKLFGAKGSFEDSFRVLVYGNAINYLLGWIPVVGFIVGLYAFYLIIVGGTVVHKISTIKSLLGLIILPIIIGVIITIIILQFMIMGALLYSSFSDYNFTAGSNLTQIANPASVYCVDQGGIIDLRTDESGGVSGYCVFPDGSECEEWAYYRGECSPENN